MAELKCPGALTLKALCSYLGYEYRSDLISTLDSYVADYEAKYTPIPPTHRVRIQRAQECAQNFLYEEGRGHTFWPPASGNELEWTRHQRDITLAVAHIIQRRAFNRYVKRKRTERAEVFGAIDNNTTTWGKRQKVHRSLSLPSSSAISRNSLYQGDDRKFENEPFGVDSETILKSWKQPAKRFSRGRCVEYLMSISPQNDHGDITAFTAEWLDKKEYSWPQSADRRMQMFMHERNCYFSAALQDNVLREIIDYVTRGTELEDRITPMQQQELQRRVELRMEFYTNHFFRMRFLDYKIDEAPKQTDCFKHTLKSLVEQWSKNTDAVADFPDRGDIPPERRRKKGKTSKSKLLSSPVFFPNLVLEDSEDHGSTAAPNTDSARDTPPQQDMAGQRSRTQSASIAVSSFEVANRQAGKEEEEQREEEGQELNTSSAESAAHCTESGANKHQLLAATPVTNPSLRDGPDCCPCSEERVNSAN